MESAKRTVLYLKVGTQVIRKVKKENKPFLGSFLANFK